MPDLVQAITRSLASPVAVALDSAALGGARSPILWTPLDLGSALVAWWDAQDTNNIILNSGNVSSWTDRKGGVAATQATGINQMPWSATARNGKAGVLPTGSQWASFTATGFPAGASVGSIAIAAYSADTNPGVQTFPFAYGSGNTTGGQSRLFLQNTNGRVSSSTSGGSPLDSAISWNTSDRFEIFSITSSTTGTLNVDGNADENGTLGTPANTVATNGNIGQWGPFGNRWNGAIQQVLVINGSLSSGNKAKLAGWESWYDGKAGANLPGGHPYKLRSPYVSDP